VILNDIVNRRFDGGEDFFSPVPPAGRSATLRERRA
jgi:hypothetical protein